MFLSCCPPERKKAPDRYHYAGNSSGLIPPPRKEDSVQAPPATASSGGIGKSLRQFPRSPNPYSTLSHPRWSVGNTTDAKNTIPCRLNELHSFATTHSAHEFKYIDQIGTGGSAAIWLAHYRNSIVAIKQFKADDISILLTEAHLLLFNNSPYIVRPVAVSFDELFLAMEYMPRGSLRRVVQQISNLPWRTRLGMMLDVCHGIQVLHAQEYAHGDIKSANVLVDSLYRVKLADFGATRPKCQSAKIFTMIYVAPELCVSPSNDVDAVKSDIYSLGILFFEMMILPHPLARYLDLVQFADDGLNYMTHRAQGNHNEIMQYVVNELVSYEKNDDVNLFAKLIRQCIDLKPDSRPAVTALIALIQEHLSQVQPDAIYLQTPPMPVVPLAPAPAEYDYWWVGRYLLPPAVSRAPTDIDLPDKDVIQAACHWFSQGDMPKSFFFYSVAKQRRMQNIRRHMKLPEGEASTHCTALVVEYAMGR